MRKIIIIIITVVSFFSSLHAVNYTSLMNAFQIENWEKCYSLSKQYLKNESNLSRTEKARLRYMYLYSLGGRFSKNNTLKEDYNKVLRGFIGKKILMPGRPTSIDHRGQNFNLILLTNKDRSKAQVFAANKAGTSIIVMERMTLKKPLDIKNYRGKVVMYGGIIKKIEIAKSFMIGLIIDIKCDYFVIMR